MPKTTYVAFSGKRVGLILQDFFINAGGQICFFFLRQVVNKRVNMKKSVSLKDAVGWIWETLLHLCKGLALQLWGLSLKT